MKIIFLDIRQAVSAVLVGAFNLQWLFASIWKFQVCYVILDESRAKFPVLANLKVKKISYKGHTIELTSDKLRSGEWVARATVIIGEGNVVKKIPIFGRRRASFDSRRRADGYALELAKLWIEGRIWGANGH
ncbi:MAG TPA: hypothetical protein VFM35_10285 [Candidatus Binatia bacterium]|nr:hypothetical protein [Candidatus Binatia bacterium]